MLQVLQCGRQFLESNRPWRYSDDIKQLCIKMYLNGMGLRGTLTCDPDPPHHCHALGSRGWASIARCPRV